MTFKAQIKHRNDQIRNGFLICLLVIGFCFIVPYVHEKQLEQFYSNEGYRNEALKLLVKNELGEKLTPAEKTELEAILND